ncbi:hypothetical protein [Desulfofalx alkaliphila]|uniref:hypothetical protein n=1 Tax=Desulfofalx alkaliphila TaxID=105483 RepID=UPI0004E24717|nr:hypothetical protein [Desulfofalx alkaliphila]
MGEKGDLRQLILNELKDLKEYQEKVKDHKYFSANEIDYLHFYDQFIKQFSKEQILEQLNKLYDEGIISAVRNPRGELFDIRLK